MGALAPIVVSAIATDMVAVFEKVNWLTALGYVSRNLLLFGLGGFVASLHKKETDAWRCFVIGISAPALITTAMAGKSGPTSPHASFEIPGWVSTAVAGELPAWLRQRTPAVEIAPVSALDEGAGGRFRRGFFGSDPVRVVVSISIAVIEKEDEARAMAAAAQVYIDCAIKNPRNKSLLVRAPELLDPPAPVVIQHRYFEIPVVQFSDVNTANVYAELLSTGKFGSRVVVSTQSRLRDDFVNRFINLNPDRDAIAISEPMELLEDSLQAIKKNNCVPR
jgi:hypothetical protein